MWNLAGANILVQTKSHSAMHSSTTSEPVTLTYDDIIFQARNRAYGAFDLRKQYRPTLSRALGLGVVLFLGALSAPTLYARFWPQASVNRDQSMTEVTLTKLAEPPVEPPISLPPPETAPAVNTVRNLPLIVMPEADVVDDTPPPTTEQLRDATSGTETAQGTGDVDVIAAPEASAPTVTEKALEVESKSEAPFITVEQQPEYPGGLDAFEPFWVRTSTTRGQRLHRAYRGGCMLASLSIRTVA